MVFQYGMMDNAALVAPAAKSGMGCFWLFDVIRTNTKPRTALFLDNGCRHHFMPRLARDFLKMFKI
jgi:hypothetical protein